MTALLKAWAAYDNDCGGGRGKTIGYFSSKKSAEVAASTGTGPGNGGVVEVWCVTGSDGDVYLVAQPEYGPNPQPQPIVLDKDLEKFKKQIRDKAIAKLTPGELEALGVVVTEISRV